jgi:CRISPR-associated protein Cmr2
MVNHSRWYRKIAALLHDPPDKPFAIGGHVGRGAELRRIALGKDAPGEDVEAAKHADWIASAADRVDFPERTEAYWHTAEAVLMHPLAGREVSLDSLADVSSTDTHEAAKRAVASLVENVADERRKYLRLWRCLPDKLAAEFPRVGALFGMLPADTRQPDHPLTQHLSITAAIADALPQPALLVFSIGPVQEFIAAARRTQDLWMGSWLLSYLSWTAMQSLAEEYGPDVIVFPSLRGQPLCDWWLHEQSVPVGKPHGYDLALATLPNKFVALLPAAEAKSAAEAAEKAVRGEWKRVTDAVLATLANGIMPIDNTARQMWEEQVKTQVEIYWSALPWAGRDESDGQRQAEAVKALYERLSFAGQPPNDWHFGKIYALFTKPRAEGGGQYHPNWGTTYSLLYGLADRAFNARKSLRDFQPSEEVGEKCTVCGQRAALHRHGDDRRGVRQFWGQAARRVQEESQKKGSLFAGHYTALKNPDERHEGRERLCAVCTVKRFVQLLYFASMFGLRGSFPSTSEIAVASFKAAVLEKLRDGQQGKKLADALRDHLETLQLLGQDGFPTTVAQDAIPRLRRLQRQVSNLSPQTEADVDRFLHYDGAAFFAETFTAQRLKDDYDLTVSEADARAARESLRRLLDAAIEGGIPSPPKYYAALMMDGDQAGQWLSGTHKGLATLGRVLHPEVRRQLENLPHWRDLLNGRRLMTPAVHAAISDALARFALKLVRFVVEHRYCGRVVYAGGDDVLALLPLDQALPAARELRALFSGEVKHQKALVEFAADEALPVAFGDGQVSGYLVNSERPAKDIIPTMGPTASASIGIAIAHHLQPLDAALQAMREAEHAAKETYDRNALCIHLLKRSGEEARVGAQWYYREANNGVVDTVALVEEVRTYFVRGLRDEKGLSMKLAHAVFDEARTLAQVTSAAQEAELYRLIYRHSTGFNDRDERSAFAKALSHRLVSFATHLQQHRIAWEKRWKERHGNSIPMPADEAEAPQPSIVQLAHWLLLARFLALGGEE